MTSGHRRFTIRLVCRSHAVTWYEDGLPNYTGKLEVTPAELRFEGASARGRTSVQTLRYDDIASVRVGRGSEERLQGRPTLLLERRSGGLIRISSLTGLGAIRELADNVEAAVSAARSR
jgi:hypothetical protein